MSEKRVVIFVEAKDAATSVLQKIGGALGDIGKIAIGGTLAAGLVGIGNGIANIGKEAFGAVAAQERLGKSLETMLAREIVKQGVQTKTVQIGSAVTQMTAKQSAANAELAVKIESAKARLAVANEHLGESIKKGKESAAEINQRKASIAALNASIGKMTAEMDKNSASAGKTVGVFKTTSTQTVTLAEAQRQAGEKAKDLMQWMEKLAIQSPFSMEDVSASIKQAMAYGFTSDEAKRLTQANVNLAAATGASGYVMQRVSLALGQMRGKGKLMGQELMQMTEAGIPFREMLIESGKVAGLTGDNFDKKMAAGLISAQVAMEAYNGYVEKNFATAAKDQAGTLAGLVSSLGDLKQAAERDFFGPIFREAQPYLNKFVDALQDPAIRAQIQSIGASVGAFVGQLITGLGQAISWVQTNWPAIQTSINAALTGISAGINTYVVPAVTAIIGALSVAIGWVQTNWPQIQGVIESVFGAISFAVNTYIIPMAQFLLAQLGVIVAWVQTNWPLIQQTVSTVFNAIKGVLDVVLPILLRVVEGAFNSIKAVVETVINAVLGVITTVMQIINGDWSAAWATIQQTVTDVWEGIKQFMGGLPSVMVGLAENLIGGLVQGILSNGDKVVQALRGLIDQAIGDIKKLLGIKSPSTVFAGIGANMALGLNAGYAAALKPLSAPAFPSLDMAGRFGGDAGQYSALFSTPSQVQSRVAPSVREPTGATREPLVIRINDKTLGEVAIDWVERRIYQDGLRYG